MYMLICHVKPQRVFEMAPNKGFSTHWILKALSLDNDTETLNSYDIHNTSQRLTIKQFRDRGTFTLGDYEELLETQQLNMKGFDFIFIDALHTEEFSRGYCRKLLLLHTDNAVVAIHDIVADEHGGR
jgi:predicted O-methyltransferase YrrM